MHTLKVTLKQHTPLIHFQHDQDGATLRASEVKPKLDRFILSRLTNEQRAQGEKEGWIKQKNDKVWLDYKMRIEESSVVIWELKKDTGKINNKTRKPIVNTIPLYFGNMNNSFQKKMLFCPQPIILEFYSSCEDLIKIIERYKDSFFLLNNFGTRQTKGFGSFLPERKSVEPNIHKDYVRFWIDFSNQDFGTWGCFFDLFTALDFFYKTLRSGINQNDVYFKSLMYFYALDVEEYWDKRAIRYEFEHFTPNKQQDKGEQTDFDNDGDYRIDNARLFRDMLGLSSSQTWKSYNDDLITKDYISDEQDGKIERFKSPLLIKPVYNNGRFDVYIFPSSIPEMLLGAQFSVSSKNRARSFTMSTPEQFDTNDFLRFITDENTVTFVIDTMDEIILTAGKERKFKAVKIAKTLRSIYNNIEYVKI